VSLLDVRGLVVAHGALEVLHDVTLAVSEGEIVTVIGPNGAGKTTLMRTLAGVLAPVRGDVVFAGRSIAGEPAHRVVRRGLALVPEGRRVFADQSVRANLELGAVSHGRRADVAAVLDRFPALRERLDAPAGTLSGGQQQILAIARGLVARPRLLLLDEPSLGLAPRLVRETFDVVRAIRAEGVSILLVEQLAALALRVADRGYVLDRGRVVAAGAAAQLLADPRLADAYLGRRRLP
jgi:branched-chain amino acid transport system ATP-binding protein/branched-chain amino acid transport system permease protein